MVSVWQMGVLLAGIGILILCIFAATTIRDVGSAIKRIERILADKNGEIEAIINNSASITDSVDGIASNINKATNIVGIVSSVSSHIADRFSSDAKDKNKGKEKRSPKTEEDYSTSQMDIDDLIKENEDEIEMNL